MGYSGLRCLGTFPGLTVQLRYMWMKSIPWTKGGISTCHKAQRYDYLCNLRILNIFLYLLKKRNKQSSTLSHSKERLPAIQELPHKESIIIKPKINQRQQLTETQQAIPVQRQESQEEKSLAESDMKGLIEVPFILKNSMGQIMDVNQNALDPYYITNIQTQNNPAGVQIFWTMKSFIYKEKVQQEMIEPRRKNQEVIRKVLREKLELDRKRVQLIQSLQSSVDSLGTIQDDQPLCIVGVKRYFKTELGQIPIPGSSSLLVVMKFPKSKTLWI